MICFRIQIRCNLPHVDSRVQIQYDRSPYEMNYDGWNLSNHKECNGNKHTKRSESASWVKETGFCIDFVFNISRDHNQRIKGNYIENK